MKEGVPLSVDVVARRIALPFGYTPKGKKYCQCAKNSE